MFVIITNGTKIVDTNALLDAGFDATLICKGVAHMLNLWGKNNTLGIGNVLQVLSSHPEKNAIDNAFVVPNLNVRHYKTDINEIRSSFPSFIDTELLKINTTDVTILIGADFPKLRIHKDFR